MRKLIAVAAAAAMSMTIAAGPQAAPPDGIQYEAEVGTGETVTIEGASDTGGTTLDDNTLDCSADDPTWKCDRVLVHYTGFGTAAADFVSSVPGADYDLDIYAADNDGNVTSDEPVATSGNAFFPVDTGLGFAPGEYAEWDAKRGEYFLVVVYYYAAGGGYTLDLSLS